ncbi:MAG: hypothetical protein FWE38_00480 [Firmicutes bacterium]|nr:hypothetical protein [Bacillota bacterium]
MQQKKTLSRITILAACVLLACGIFLVRQPTLHFSVRASGLDPVTTATATLANYGDFMTEGTRTTLVDALAFVETDEKAIDVVIHALAALQFDIPLIEDLIATATAYELRAAEFTPASIATLSTAREDAFAAEQTARVNTGHIILASTVAAYRELESAIAGLDARVLPDTTDLVAAISTAQGYLDAGFVPNTDTHMFTKDSFQYVYTMISNATALVDSPTRTLEQINAYIKSLSDVPNLLVADYTNLQNLIETLTLVLDDPNFTTESRETIRDAMKTIQDMTDMTIAELVAAYTYLSAAGDGLRAVRTDLISVIELAQTIRQSFVTPASWMMLDTALTRAIYINDTATSSPSEIATAANLLQHALDLLTSAAQTPLDTAIAATAGVNATHFFTEAEWINFSMTRQMAISVRANTNSTVFDLHRAFADFDALLIANHDPDITTPTHDAAYMERLDILRDYILRVLETFATAHRFNFAWSRTFAASFNDAIARINEFDFVFTVNMAELNNTITILNTALSDADDNRNWNTNTAEINRRPAFDLIIRAQGFLDGTTSYSDYTYQSVANFIRYVNETLLDLFNNPDTTNNEITAAVTHARGLLLPNRLSLANTITNALMYVELRGGEDAFTPETWTTFDTAITLALSIMNNPEATMDLVREAQIIILMSVELLRLRPVITPTDPSTFIYVLFAVVAFVIAVLYLLFVFRSTRQRIARTHAIERRRAARMATFRQRMEHFDGEPPPANPFDTRGEKRKIRPKKEAKPQPPTTDDTNPEPTHQRRRK